MCRYNHIHVAEVLAAKAVETLPLIPDTLRHVAEVLAAKAVETFFRLRACPVTRSVAEVLAAKAVETMKNPAEATRNSMSQRY